MIGPSKTKIVCTIGPASQDAQTLQHMIRAGMNVARLNFSHGDLTSHGQVIEAIRAAARATGKRVAIMADLPGPKLRVGQLAEEPIELLHGEELVLTTEELLGDRDRVSVSFAGLPSVVSAGDTLFLNDGLIQLTVLGVAAQEVRCRVQTGGELRSRKGLNLPGVDLGISAFTEHDHECLRFAMAQGVDAVSQSFVATAEDVRAVRAAAQALGHSPFVIAKIERRGALDNLAAILELADGIMVARGDLGVEIPIERMAVVQKDLMERANSLGKPVITATQMLLSMVQQRRPTRAEATDVANAILDGTDCVMLSEESAMGRYPVDAVSMLARIAIATEPYRRDRGLRKVLKENVRQDQVSVVDVLALSVERTVERASPVAVVTPTRSGATARSVARFRLPVWITAFSPSESTCQALQFSYGVQPVRVDAELADWTTLARDWLRDAGLTSGLAVLTQGPSAENPCGNHRMEIVELER